MVAFHEVLYNGRKNWGTRDLILALFLILLVVVITFGLGYWNFKLGQKGKSYGIGLIIPVGYFIAMVAMTAMAHGKNGSLSSSVVSSLLIAAVYYIVFTWGLKGANKK